MKIVRLDLNELNHLVGGRDATAAAETARSVWGEVSLFMLRPELCGTPPVVPLEKGATGAFLVWDQTQLGTALKGVFQPAFYLPLCWKDGVPDSPRLPASLTAIAQSIRTTLAKESKGDTARQAAINSFGLHPADRLVDVDLSVIPLAVESAWAPLAAGLIVALYGGKPSDGVFATGAWNDGISEVQGIKAKIEAAIALAGVGVHVFVPVANFEEAKSCAGKRASVRDLPSGQASASESLLPYLLALAAPPSKATALLPERCNYANQDFVIADRRARSSYYQRELLADLADELAEKSGSSFGVRRLALGLSLNWDVDALLIRALKPSEVLLLGSRESIGLVMALQENLKDHPYINVGPPLELTDSNAAFCCDEIAAWLEKDSLATAVDITAATKDMSSVLLIAARRSNARVLYLRHKTRGPAPLYGTGSLTSLDWALE